MTSRPIRDRADTARPEDGEPLHLQQRVFVVAAILYGVLGFVWGTIYMMLGLTVPALVPYSYVALTTVVLVFYRITSRFVPARTVILAAWLVLPLTLQLILGGFVPASAVAMWSIAAPIGALFFAPRQAGWWGMGFFLVMAVAWIADPVLEPMTGLDDAMVSGFFALNLGGVGAAVVFILRDFLKRLQKARRELELERDRSESLLLNVLPEPIAERLKSGEDVIADGLEDVSVVFADLVGFTSMSQGLPAKDVVDVLDRLVADFDRLVDRHGMEKIRTMGDAYMAVAGAPTPQPGHLETAALMALEMLEIVHSHTDPQGNSFEVRIGLDSGPVVAGVIGLGKFVYDVWGNTVNTASRMESHGLPGKIQVTPRVYKSLRGSFRFEERGTIDVKGVGPMSTYLLLGTNETDQ